MKEYIKITLVSMMSMMLFHSCITKLWAKPKWFTATFDNKDTGLNQLLDTDGAFLCNVPEGKGTSYHIVFFDNGLVALSGSKLPTKENANLFDPPINKSKGGWGCYSVKDSIISVQIIADNGIDGLKTNREFYKIIDRKHIRRIGYISYHNKYFEQNYAGDYVPVPNRIDSTNWLLKKKWFWKKGAKK
jgi:hypothetical protein